MDYRMVRIVFLVPSKPEHRDEDELNWKCQIRHWGWYHSSRL